MDERYTILDDDNKLIVVGSTTWARWFERNTERRRVGSTEIDLLRVSTVFLGINHGSGGQPLYFETMVFDADGREVSYTRTNSWKNALELHERTVEMFRQLQTDGQREAGRLTS